MAQFRSAMGHVLRGKLKARPIMSSRQAMLDYLRATMAFDHIERVRILYLNTRNVLIGDEIISEGTIDEAAIYVREVLRRAIDLGAAAIILVHNHPSGDPSPSRADLDITRRLAEAGKRIGVYLYDHIVVATDGHTSLRESGLL